MYDHSVYQRTENKTDNIPDTLDDPDCSSRRVVDIRPIRQTEKGSKAVKHGVPLTSFQEKLFDIVLKAFKETESRHPILKMDTDNDFILKIQEQKTDKKVEEPVKQCNAYPKETWKDDLKFWSGCLYDYLSEHINKIFLTIMTGNILWMQILTSHMDMQDQNRGAAEIFKWLLILITLLFTLQLLWRKAKNGWKRLKHWAEK